jgi:hypothetical protein
MIFENPECLFDFCFASFSNNKITVTLIPEFYRDVCQSRFSAKYLFSERMHRLFP